MFFNNAIAPQFIQLIKLTLWGQENMNDNVYVIKQYPFGMLQAFVMPWLFAKQCLRLLHNVIGNGFHLRCGGRITHNKKITYGILNLSKINAYNMLTFFVADTFNDDSNIALRLLFPGRRFFLYFQCFDRLFKFWQN